MLNKQNDKSSDTQPRVNMLTAAVITAGLVFSAIPANAYIPRDNQVSIRVNPVDLQTETGIQRVYEYMTREAEIACASVTQNKVINRRHEAKCTAALLEDFVFDLGDQRMITFHKRQVTA